MIDGWLMDNCKIFKCKTSSISITSGLSRDPKRGPFLGWDWPENRKVRQRLQIEQIELGKKFFLWNGSFFIMTLSFAFGEYCFYWSTIKIDSYQGQTTKLYICNLHLVNVSLIVSSSAVMRTSMLYISSTWMRTISIVLEENKILGSEDTFSLETSSSSHIWICLPENPLEVLLINTLVTIVFIDNGDLGLASH